jgi:polyferredoxin
MCCGCCYQTCPDKGFHYVLPNLLVNISAPIASAPTISTNGVEMMMRARAILFMVIPLFVV